MVFLKDRAISMKNRRYKYTSLHIKLFFNILFKGKVSFKKIINWLHCYLAYTFKTEKSGKSPYMVSVELWNECNVNCVFCRNQQGDIYNLDPHTEKAPIPKGKMPVEMAIDIIDQFKDTVLICVLYTNGEPLIYHDLAKVIQFATNNRVATMIATNGLLLDERRGRAILDAGLDFVKIQLSGFTQDIYSVQIKQGNIEKWKINIRNFAQMNQKGNYKTLILIDYILYQYNAHQLPLIEEFCSELGLMLSLRPGNPSHGLEETEPPQSSEQLPLTISCDWLWKGMQINWNGDVLQCCEGVVYRGVEPYHRLVPRETKLKDIWNGPQAIAMRNRMTKKGRGDIPICSQCQRKGLSFKW